MSPRARDRRRPPALAIAALVLIAVAVAVAGVVRVLRQPPTPKPPPPAAERPVLGVLIGDTHHLSSDEALGVRQVTVISKWSSWEPAPGRFSDSYRRYVAGEVRRYRDAGFAVAVDVGLQYPPRWALRLPDGALVDQDGHAATVADFWFSTDVRRAAARYVDRVVSSLGPVRDYRVGLSENGETLFPDTTTNQWWAFAASAQGKDRSHLPAGVGTDPMPGWVPGSPTWRHATLDAGAVGRWYSWYFGASVNAIAWEIGAYRQAGYRGQLELVMPGTGALPAFYDQRLAAGLADGAATGSHYDDYYTLNTAAVWWRLLDSLPDLEGVAVDTSSVFDASGYPQGNPCQPSDRSVAPTDPAVWQWSDTRWQAYLAARHHLPIMGETPGPLPASQLPGLVRLARSCGLTTLQWAFDDDLYPGGSGATAAQVAHAFDTPTSSSP